MAPPDVVLHRRCPGTLPRRRKGAAPQALSSPGQSSGASPGARGGAERGRRSPSLLLGAQRSPATARSRTGNFTRLRSRRGAFRGLRGDKGRGLAERAGPGLQDGDAARRVAEPGARSGGGEPGRGAFSGLGAGSREGSRVEPRRNWDCGATAWQGGTRQGSIPLPAG